MKRLTAPLALLAGLGLLGRPGSALSQEVSPSAPDWAEAERFREVSPAVRRIVGLRPGVGRAERLREIEGLSLLAPVDRELILRYLEEPVPVRHGVLAGRGGEFEIKNQLMNRLRFSAVPAGVQYRCHQALFEDEERDAVIRDYAVQHAADLLRREDCSAGLQADIVSSLFSLTRSERDSPIAGTALLSLSRLFQVESEGAGPGRDGAPFPPFPEQDVLSACRALATDPDAHTGSRAAAVAVAGEVTSGSDLAVPDWIGRVMRHPASGVSGNETETEKPAPRTVLVLACARALVDSEDPAHHRAVESYVEALRESEGDERGGLLLDLLEKMLGVDELPDPEAPENAKTPDRDAPLP